VGYVTLPLGEAVVLTSHVALLRPQCGTRHMQSATNGFKQATYCSLGL